MPEIHHQYCLPLTFVQYEQLIKYFISETHSGQCRYSGNTVLAEISNPEAQHRDNSRNVLPSRLDRPDLGFGKSMGELLIFSNSKGKT